MKLCRFQPPAMSPRVGLVLRDAEILDLASLGIERLQPLLEHRDPVSVLTTLAKQRLPRYELSQVRLLAPVEQQEVWAAGVTYVRSKSARMEESQFAASAYDRVYEAPRPELFFKALPEKVVGPDEPVGIRRDGRWNVPEPELALVLDSTGRLAGFTIGNDMSSRDIEGENLLYLPQAKIYHRSCALGPFVLLETDETAARRWRVRMQVLRANAAVFGGETSIGQIKRSFAELAEPLFRCQSFPNGAILLTGTGIVPPDDFTLQPGDRVRIAIDEIGVLENTVVEV